jgi:hypothetical protein
MASCSAHTPLKNAAAATAAAVAPFMLSHCAADIANAVLDGVDGILLGAETLRGSYPVEAVATIAEICRCGLLLVLCVRCRMAVSRCWCSVAAVATIAEICKWAEGSVAVIPFS